MNDSQKIEIGKRLIELRKNKGLTQLEVSQATEINRTTINNYELGARKVKLDDVIILSKLYSTTTDYILTGIQAENRSISETTGLSQGSIKTLKGLKEICDDNLWSEASRWEAQYVLTTINNILECRKSNPNIYMPHTRGCQFILQIGEYFNLEKFLSNLPPNDKRLEPKKEKEFYMRLRQESIIDFLEMLRQEIINNKK